MKGISLLITLLVGTSCLSNSAVDAAGAMEITEESQLQGKNSFVKFLAPW
jgi:hypothetical protein